LAKFRRRSLADASSARIVWPVNRMKASSNELDAVCSLSAAGVPRAMILP
jgi:hypothetical protein